MPKGEFDSLRMYVEPKEAAALTPDQVKYASCTPSCSVHTTLDLPGKTVAVAIHVRKQPSTETNSGGDNDELGRVERAKGIWRGRISCRELGRTVTMGTPWPQRSMSFNNSGRIRKTVRMPMVAVAVGKRGDFCVTDACGRWRIGNRFDRRNALPRNGPGRRPIRLLGSRSGLS